MVPPPNVCSQSMRTRDCLEGDAVKFPLVPDFYFESIHAIDLARLRARGVRLLLADLDNTLVPYGVHTPTQPVRAWKQALDQADVILAKGMGNTETMLGCGYNVYYAFLVKCPRFVQIFNKPMFTPMLIRDDIPLPQIARGK